MKDFFISYNKADKTWAEWIAWVLEENGYTVAIQAWDFRPGGNFILDMQRAAEESHRTIMVLSEDYLKAKYTQPEWAAAFKQDPTAEERRLIPIRVAKCTPTGMLAPLVYVDLVEKTEAEAEQLVLDALKDRAKPAIRPSFPDSTSAAERVTDQKNEFPGLAAAPNNLPRSGAIEFVGRDQELINLHTQLHQTSRIAITALRGMGGIGKTELALQYAKAHRDLGTYPGGICWLQARDQDVASQIVQFAKKVGLTPTEGELAEQVDYVWDNWPLSPSAMLVIYDDVADFANIEPYLPPQTEQFRVLLTTRQRFSGINSLEIDVLSPDAALDLLRSIVGTDRINAQLTEAAALCTRLGRLPLALELVGRYLELDEDLTILEVQAELDEMRTYASALLKDESAATMTAKLGVAEAFELSLRRLDAASQTLATLLCLFAATPIAWDWVQACLADVPTPTLRQQRNKLLQNSLLQRVDQDVYQLHPLIQEFLRVRFADLSTAPLQQNYCKAIAQAANQIGQTQTQDDILRLTPLIPHIEEAATTWQRFISDDEVIAPATRVGMFYYSQGAFRQAKPWLEMACKSGRDRLNEAHPAVATSLNNLAELYRSQGRYSEAEPLLQQALALRKQLLGEAHPDVAQSLNNLALLYDSQGRYSEAEPLNQQVLALRKQLLGEAHPDVAQSLNNLALLYDSQGRYSEAAPLYQAALILTQESGQVI